MARFPFVKPLESFDFRYQPSIDRKQVLQLASCHFIEHGDNVIVLGPDRGGHYQWPGWLSRIAEAKLVRSMSRKGAHQTTPRARVSSAG